jgi:putrescine aminotransferase
MCRQFRPMLDGVKYVTFGDSTAIDAAIDEQTGCVIVEPIQSENGAVVPPGGYLRELQDICRRRGVLLVFDEVKTGIAKTGRLFACEFDGAVPDILVCGKALGGGVMPVGAVVSRREAWGRFGLSFPMSSSSGSGNAPACAAALATLELVRAEDLCSKAERQGSRLIAALRTTARSYPEKILDVSGRGLLIGVKTPSLNLASRIVSQCAKLGVLVMNAFCDRTKILVEPPACISDAQVGIVEQVFKEAVAACPL